MPHGRRCVKIAYNAGLRRNEVVYLAWDDVDFENETITVCNSDDHSTKSRKIRTLPMNSDIIKALKALRPRMFQNPYVFRDRLTESLFLHTFEQIVINAGHVITKDGKKKNKFSFHDLRRTFGTNLANKGISPKILQKLMGHALLATTMKYYINADMDQQRKAVESLVKIA